MNGLKTLDATFEILILLDSPLSLKILNPYYYDLIIFDILALAIYQGDQNKF